MKIMDIAKAMKHYIYTYRNGGITMAGMIISGVCFGITALLSLGIGISQLISKSPVGFYSGETPPSADEISDVHMWNKKHGTMWLIYGVIIILTWICGLFLGDSIWAIVPVLSGVIIPIIVMIWYHHRLVKKYKIK